MEAKNQSATASWLNVVAGIYLLLSPFLWSYANMTARANDLWVGIIVGVLALIRAIVPLSAVWISWVTVVVGLWEIIAPFALRYTGTISQVNDIVLGIIVTALALWSSGATSASHGGQHAHA